MSTRTTYFGPKVSFRTSHSDPDPVHVYGDSNSTFEWAGPATFSGAVTLGGSALNSLNVSTVSVDFASVAGNDSASTTATINAVTADSVVLSVQPASIWSGAYYDLALSAYVSAASTVAFVAANSAATAVDPDAMNMTVVWIDPS